VVEKNEATTGFIPCHKAGETIIPEMKAQILSQETPDWECYDALYANLLIAKKMA